MDVRRRLARGCADQLRSGDHESHRSWVELLLTDYYDPMYAYQRESKAPRIEFSGNQAAVLDYLRQRDRVTRQDRDIERRLEALTTDGNSRTRRFIAEA